MHHPGFFADWASLTNRLQGLVALNKEMLFLMLHWVPISTQNPRDRYLWPVLLFTVTTELEVGSRLLSLRILTVWITIDCISIRLSNMNSFMFNSGCPSLQDWPSLFGICYCTDSGSDCVHKTKGGSRECKRKLLQKKRLVTWINCFM